MADNKLDIKAFLDKDEQKDLLRLWKIDIDRSLAV